jgi:hemin uptake protein HemP
MRMPTPDHNATSTAAQNTGTETTTLQTMHSSELLGGQGAIRIDHKGAIYTLRATSKGGLILTK